jgi:hypothetical protein
MFYPNTVASLRKYILIKFPRAKAAVETNKTIDQIKKPFFRACYALWMLDRLQTFTGGDDPVAEAARRGRWIGYVQRELEVLEIVTNEQNRAMIRLDPPESH